MLLWQIMPVLYKNAAPQNYGATFIIYSCGNIPSILNRGFSFKHAAYEPGIKLRPAVIGVKTVLLLLDVGKLSVTETEHFRIIQQHVGQTLKAVEKFLLGFRSLAVAPA